MWRMSILDNYYGEGKSIRDKITELEEENKSLKNEIMEDNQLIRKLTKEYLAENKKLKEDVDYRHNRCMEAEKKLPE